MSQTERLYRIVHLLENARQPLPLERFLDELEISRATFKRDLDYLRDRLGAPIRWARGGPGEPAGYRLEGPAEGMASPARGRYGIRGLWFNPSEIHALLMMRQLAAGMEPGLLSEQTGALMTRISLMLGSADDEPLEVARRVRILHSASHRRSAPCFQDVAHATLKRLRLSLRYFSRSRGEEGEREVSPQQLLHYRENWYLHAWCHKAEDLRLFALDAMRAAEVLKTPARELAPRTLERSVGQAFGIFAARPSECARLLFSPRAASWAASETWHPRQRQELLADGSLRLEVPYGDPRELVMEILRYGPEVEVLAPDSLRTQVAEQLAAALGRYRG